MISTGFDLNDFVLIKNNILVITNVLLLDEMFCEVNWLLEDSIWIRMNKLSKLI